LAAVQQTLELEWEQHKKELSELRDQIRQRDDKIKEREDKGDGEDRA
jgi:hypothetical protein